MHSTRRDFITQTSLGLAGSILAGNCLLSAQNTAPQKTLIGSNIYGWGQYYQREKKKMEVAEVISALRDAGYHYLEGNLDVANPGNNARFADQLKAKGLQPVSIYTGARLHEAGKATENVAKILAAARICREAGFQVISCNPDPIGREKSDDELKSQLAALIELGEGLNRLGMRLGIHHHMPEMASNAREFHYNFRNSKPEVVGFCYDVHWVWKGGLAPAEVLKEYSNRIATWHLRQSRDRVWWEDLDTGDIDYSAVAKFAREHNLPRLFTVELALEGGTKITRSAVENHRRSLEFVRKVFGP